jgi:hypothetical protein
MEIEISIKGMNQDDYEQKRWFLDRSRGDHYCRHFDRARLVVDEIPQRRNAAERGGGRRGSLQSDR